MLKKTFGAVVATLLLGVGSVSAHHPFSQDFDSNKPVTLTGTITQVQWTSPHVYTHIDVKDPQGKVTSWRIEMGSPTELTKAGWTRAMLKAGEMVTLQGWQAKNGTSFANADEMTLSDGKKLSAMSSFHSGKDHGVPTTGSGTPKPSAQPKKSPY